MNTIIKFYIKKYIYKKIDRAKKQINIDTTVNDILEEWANSSTSIFLS
jgi:hypothetical protein